MPRKPTALTAATVRTAKPGRYGDGNGLYLTVRPTATRFWVFRYTMPGCKMREMGLGRAGADLAAVPLSEARAKAAGLLRLVRSGVDPLDKRLSDAEILAAAARDAALRAITFREAAARYIHSHESSWRNPKHRQQWVNTLATYADPHFGHVPVSSIQTTHVLAALQPIWSTKTETAGRVRGRVEAVLDYAKACGWRTDENPAAWKGHLALTLPARSKLAPVEHHAALPWSEVAKFLETLAKQPGTAACALAFVVLMAARSGEALGARWAEVDLVAKVWTVPAHRMKAKREHRVPLSEPALALLRVMLGMRLVDYPDGFLLPGAIGGRPLSVMSMAMVLRRMKRGDLTVHGFRSSFRDWVGEATATPREVAEAALAHAVGSKTEAAYARGDLFEKRRLLMDSWAEYCEMRSAPSRAAVALIEVGAP